MESLSRPEGVDVYVPPRSLDETIHLIRKLRWMGLDDEAKTPEAAVAFSCAPTGDNVVGGPQDTD